MDSRLEACCNCPSALVKLTMGQYEVVVRLRFPPERLLTRFTSMTAASVCCPCSMKRFSFWLARLPRNRTPRPTRMQTMAGIQSARVVRLLRRAMTFVRIGPQGRKVKLLGKGNTGNNAGIWCVFHPWRGEKNPRPPPRPLLSQGVNQPEVSGWRGAESSTGAFSLIRDAWEPWSLARLRVIETRREVTRKKALRLECL